jgi:ribosome production factor 2
VLKTFHTLTRPHSTLLTKKNENIHPFENADSLEFLAEKNEAGIVVFGSSSKKRPNAVTVVRIFDGRVLEMVELLLLGLPHDVEEEKGEEAGGKEKKLQVGVEMKPMILFAGSVWADTSASEMATTYSMVKSLLLDIFSGEEVRSMDVEGLQYLLMVAAGEPEDGQNPNVHLRWYKVRTRKSGQKLPRVELDEVGPKFDFKVGRIKEADAGVMREAMKKRKQLDGDFKAKQKNVGMDTVGDKIGRVHLSRQDLGQLQTRKMKGLKRGAALPDDEEMGDRMEIDEVSEDEVAKKPRLA